MRHLLGRFDTSLVSGRLEATSLCLGVFRIPPAGFSASESPRIMKNWVNTVQNRWRQWSAIGGNNNSSFLLNTEGDENGSTVARGSVETFLRTVFWSNWTYGGI